LSSHSTVGEQPSTRSCVEYLSLIDFTFDGCPLSRQVAPTLYSLMVISASTNVNFKLTNVVEKEFIVCYSRLSADCRSQALQGAPGALRLDAMRGSSLCVRTPMVGMLGEATAWNEERTTCSGLHTSPVDVLSPCEEMNEGSARPERKLCQPITVYGRLSAECWRTVCR
jgi:hypothetical protein